MARLSLSLLGPPAVELDGQPVKLGRHKAVALLAYLALTRRGHHRDALSTMLWPDLAQSAARAELRRTLSLLNRTLGSEWFTADRELAGWAAEAEAWLDVDLLRQRLAACKTHGHPLEEACSACVPLLTEAVELYRGGFLAGFTLPDAPAFDEWQFFETEALRDEVAGALQRLARWHDAQGAYEVAIAFARRWLALDPLHEPAHRQLMALYAHSGQRSAALRQYVECERALKQELNVAPAEETTRLWEQIRHGTLGTETGFLGETRFLADWVVAEAGPRHNLPAQVTSFVGRERELMELGRLLADPDVRLVTVVGPGGMGKTRLALQAARAALDQTAFAEAWLVDLAPAVDGAVVPRAVAAALGVQEQPDRPLPETIAGALQTRKLLLVVDNCEHVLEGTAPLVALLLSRCPELTVLATSREPLRVPGEQLYEAPPMALPATSDPTERLLDADAVQLFCRRAAAVRPGFALDDQGAPLAGQICRRLDGMPLAIELAAARLRALSLPDLAHRLDDRFRLLSAGSRTALPRQQTLRNIVDWSYDLLSEAEQLLFARLSVFAGSFSLEAAEAACSGDGVRHEEVLDLLAGLVDKSLVSRVEGPEGATRYRLLETFHAYGEDRLSERGEAEEVAARHAWHYVSLAEAIESVLWSNEEEQIPALRRLDAEAENLAAAMRWSLARSQPEVAMRVGGALHLWTMYRPYYPQYAEWLRQALAQGEAVLPLYQAKALDLISCQAWNWGRYNEMAAAAEAELNAARASGEHKRVAAGLFMVGSSTAEGGDYTQARAHYQESLKVARECGDHIRALYASTVLTSYEPLARRQALLGELLSQAPYGLRAWILQFLAGADWTLGDLEAAQAHSQESLAGWTEVENRGAQGLLCISLADITVRRGDHARAEQLLERARDLARQTGNYRNVIWITRLMGRLSWQCNDLEKASSRFQECLDLAREHRYPWEAAAARIVFALVAAERGEYDAADALCQQALPDLPPADDEGWVMALCAQGRIALLRGEAARAMGHYRAALVRLRLRESRPDICEVLEFLGWALAADGKHTDAARLLAFAERERTGMGIILPPIDRPRHEHALEAVRAARSQDLRRFGDLEGLPDGQALDMEGAMALALHEGEEHNRRPATDDR